jgi:fused signal recognition particle receptor
MALLKGGVIIPIVDELDIPVRFIGVGEQIDDLQVFNPKIFTEALFETN